MQKGHQYKKSWSSFLFQTIPCVFPRAIAFQGTSLFLLSLTVSIQFLEINQWISFGGVIEAMI